MARSAMLQSSMLPVSAEVPVLVRVRGAERLKLVNSLEGRLKENQRSLTA